MSGTLQAVPATEGGPRKVLMVLPYDMSARHVIETSVARLLAARDDLDVTVVSRKPSDGDALAALPGRPLAWHPMLRPFRKPAQGVAGSSGRRHRFVADLRFALGFCLHLSLVFRFNWQKGFRGFRDRLRQSAAARRQAFREGLPSLRLLGFPLPGSRWVYDRLHRLLYSAWQTHLEVEKLFDQARPELLVLTHLQNGLVTPYLLAARHRGIPILGINGSWDQPTTKGPLVPGVTRILAQGERVKADLIRYHDMPAERIDVVGWPQMDIYADPAARGTRSALLADLGLAKDTRYILVGAYAQRLGVHEPEMCRRLGECIRDGAFGARVTLYIRCHPLDTQWQRRLQPLHDPPWVVVEPPERGRLEHLARLLAHAEVVIASAGTISLDAVALDTPAIAVAFEDERLPYYERPVRRYDMEHYAAVVETKGVRLVSSQTALEAAVVTAMQCRQTDSAARAALRSAHLDPLDGQAAARIAAAIAAAAKDASAPGGTT